MTDGHGFYSDSWVAGKDSNFMLCDRKYHARSAVGEQMKSQEMLGGFLEEMLRALKGHMEHKLLPQQQGTGKVSEPV